MVVDKVKDYFRRDETRRLSFFECLIFIVGAGFLYYVDLVTLWNGYRIETLPLLQGGLLLVALNILLSGYFLPKLIRIVVEGRRNQSHWTEFMVEAALYFMWIVIALIGLTNPISTVHLFYSVAVYLIFKKALGEDRVGFDWAILIITFMDFFGFAILKAGVNLLPGIAIQQGQFSRLMMPLWIFYVIGFSITHNGHWLWSLLLLFVTGFYLAMAFNGVSLIAQQTDQMDRGVVTIIWNRFKLGANRIVDLPGEFISEWNIFWNEATNTSYYYYDSEEEQSQLPQGVFLKELTGADLTYREGSPAYVWAQLEARTLEKEIPVSTICYTEIETEAGNQLIMGKIEGGSFTVFSGVERSISCEFPNLQEGEYTIFFNATFKFVTDGRKKVYLMDRARMINDLKALIDKGLEPNKANILTELYDVTDIEPESIFTTGAVKLGIGTDSVPWDIGSDVNIRALFGVSIENNWPQGGHIVSIDNLQFIIPNTFDIMLTTCDVTFTGPTTDGDNKVYTITEPITDVDQSKSINCLMTVGPNSLDAAPLTTRFLKANVDYTFVLQEKVNIKVQGYGFGEEQEIVDRFRVCCESQFKSTTITGHEWKDNAQQCLEQAIDNYDFIYRVVDNSNCEQVCCYIIQYETGSYEIMTRKDCEERSDSTTHTVPLDISECP